MYVVLFLLLCNSPGDAAGGRVVPWGRVGGRMVTWVVVGGRMVPWGRCGW